MVVVDDADRENEGDLVFAASAATPELLAFTIRHARGLICVPMLGADLDRLHLPQMTSQNQEHHGTAFTLSVDARNGISTGISAADRARTIQLLASPSTGHDDLVRPGHVFPLRYAEGGVLRRRGHTEAAVDLARLAGQPPAGVVCRDRQRRRHDDAPPGPARVRGRARPRADLDRAAHRLPPPHRTAGYPRRADPDPELLRPVARLRVPQRHRRCRAPRARPRRHRRRRGRR